MRRKPYFIVLCCSKVQQIRHSSGQLHRSSGASGAIRLLIYSNKKIKDGIMTHTFSRRVARRTTGFTLIEVMVVVAIIGILSAIAIPAYTDYVTRSKIPDATSALAAKRVQMEQFFQDNHTYTGGPGCVADATTSKYFTFNCVGDYGVAATDSVYTIEAVGVGSMAGFVFTIDQSNNKGTTMTAGAPSGWTSNANCWVAKKGGAC